VVTLATVARTWSLTALEISWPAHSHTEALNLSYLNLQQLSSLQLGDGTDASESAHLAVSFAMALAAMKGSS